MSSTKSNLARSSALARLLTITVAASALSAFGAGVSLAADQPASPATGDAADTVTSVVVTGIRQSLEAAAQVKRSSDEVVEVVAAEDIGKLPDESIADTLTRLPGLAGQRVGGRYQDLSIRGLPTDFTATLLDGFQQASVGDNRAAEFDQYPSEVINRITVYKTPEPDYVGQGLAGTVNLQTLNPLDSSHRVFVLNVRGSDNSEGKVNPGTKTQGDRISGAYIDKFANDTVGLAVAVAHSDTPEQEHHYHAWWWSGAPGTSSNSTTLNGAELYNYSRTNKRDSLMGSLEFRPQEHFHSVNTLYFSKFKETELMHGVEWEDFAESTGPVLNPTYTTIAGQNYNTGGTAQGMVPILISDYNTRQDTLLTYISRNTYDAKDWTLHADLNYSYADRKETLMEQYAQYGATRTLTNLTYSNTTQTNGFPQFSSGLNYANASQIYLGDPAPWGGWGHDGTAHDPTERDTISEGKLTGHHDFAGSWGNLFSSVDLGFDYSDRVKHKTEADYNLFLKNSGGPGAYSSAASTALPASAVNGVSDFGFAGFGPIVAYNPQSVLSLYNITPIDDTNQYDKEWQVTEDLATVFAKAEIDSRAFWIPIRGNIGAQYVYSEQKSQGFVTTQGGPNGSALIAPFDKSVGYGEFLPSLNLKFELTSSDVVHVGIAREMSRPRLDALRADGTGSLSAPFVHPSVGASVPCTPSAANAATCYGQWSGSGGNPNLRPWLGNALDLTYEKYFSKSSYIEAAYFYKSLDTYIYTQVDPNHSFQGYPNNTNYPMGPTNPYIGAYTTPENGHGGHIEGLEFSTNLGGELINPLLTGFGVNANIARNWTDIKPQGPSDTSGQKLPGFSKWEGAVTAYYEKGGAQFRISERYRSEYVGEVASLFANLTYTEIAATHTTDAQASYEFKTGQLKGLTLLLQGNNLSNEPYREYLGFSNNAAPNNLSKYETYGRVVLIGFNYKM